MKQRIIILAGLLLLCLLLGGCGTSEDENNIEDFVGEWQAVREYQDGRLITDEELGFYLTINSDHTWTLKDDLAPKPQTGTLESYEGLPCLYYDDYLYVLEKNEDDLSVHTKNLKDEDYPTGEFIFQRLKKDDFFTSHETSPSKHSKTED